jgi:hypothetical protein
MCLLCQTASDVYAALRSMVFLMSRESRASLFDAEVGAHHTRLS